MPLAPAMPRKVALALGKRDGEDTALLCAYAAEKVLTRSDVVTALHVSDTPAPSWCACDAWACSCFAATRWHATAAPLAADARAAADALRVVEGEKRATTYTADSNLPPWIPDSCKELMRAAFDEPATAAELDAGSAVSAADAIVDFCATELKPDLLLLGARPRGLISRVFASSVSSYAVENSETPVLVVRGSALALPREPATPLQLGDAGAVRRIALCLDGSPAGRRMVAWAAATLLRPADDIYLLHSPAGLEAADLLPAMGEIEACRIALISHGFPENHISPVELDFRTDTRDALVDFLEAGPKAFDACIVGSRGLHGTLTRLMLGSVVRYLLLYAPCPLLVLPNAMLREPPAVETVGPPV